MLEHIYPLLTAGEYSEIYLEDSKSTSVRWENEKPEQILSHRDSGAGIRIINQFETRFGHLDLIDPFSRLSGAELQNLGRLKSDLCSDLSEKSFNHPKELVTWSHPAQRLAHSVSLDEKIELLRFLDKTARAHTGVMQVILNYGDKFKLMGIVTSEGRAVMESRPYVVLSMLITTEKDGEIQTAYDAIGGVGGFEILNRDKLLTMTNEVVERAFKKLVAPPAPIGESRVVLHSSAGGTLIHEAIGHSLEADAVLEGTSPAYLGKIGTKVAHDKLTVFDNPLVPGSRGSFFVDDEGTPAEATVLIDQGVLKTYLYDRLSAMRNKTSSNGHGRRESYKHRPIPRMSNTYIAPGEENPEEIVHDLREGFLVTKMGGGQVNPTNGDFVFDVEEGFKVVNGKKELVKGATLLGKGPDVLNSISRIGRDHGWGIGTCGKEGQGVPVSDAIPTIMIDRLIIGGRSA